LVCVLRLLLELEFQRLDIAFVVRLRFLDLYPLLPQDREVSEHEGSGGAGDHFLVLRLQYDVGGSGFVGVVLAVSVLIDVYETGDRLTGD